MLKKLLMKLFMPKARVTTAGELSKMFDLKLRGCDNTKITGIAPIADAMAGQITFYSTEKIHETFKILPIEVLKNTNASVIVLQPEQVKDAPKNATLLITESPRGAVIKILDFLYTKPPKPGVRRGATVRRGAKIHKTATIESGAFIGPNAIIGPGCFVGPNAYIDNATLGKNCIIQPSAVIGKPGFGFAMVDGKAVHIPHVGRAILGDFVGVGACSCIERGTISDTVIGDYTQLGSLVQVAHNTKVGRECFMTGSIAIAGACVIGDRVMIGGGTVVNNKIKIGDGASIGGGSSVLKDIPAGETWLGYPAVPGYEFLRQNVWLRRQIRPL
jgi:UDP-3-O-[3-hydroxymyristoyl] glucosamine N-acyltransferase